MQSEKKSTFSSHFIPPNSTSSKSTQQFPNKILTTKSLHSTSPRGEGGCLNSLKISKLFPIRHRVVEGLRLQRRRMQMIIHHCLPKRPLRQPALPQQLRRVFQ